MKHTPKMPPPPQWLVWLLGGLLLMGIVAAVAAALAPKSPADDGDVKVSTQEAEKRRDGFHCLAAWDGSHRGVVAQVEAGLRDPSSFKHLETLISPVSVQGFHRLTMEYTATNGYGGVNRGRVEAAIDTKTCKATILGQVE